MKTKKDIQEFKKELKVLLIKYDVFLCIGSSGGSDWHGVYNERFSVYDNATNKELERLNDGQIGLSAKDL